MNKKLIAATFVAALVLSGCSKWFAPPTEIVEPMLNTEGTPMVPDVAPPLAIPTGTPVVIRETVEVRVTVAPPPAVVQTVVVVQTSVPPTPLPPVVQTVVVMQTAVPQPTPVVPTPVVMTVVHTVTTGVPLTPAIGASWVYTSLQYDSMPNWDCSKPGPFTTALMPGQKNYAAYYICVANAARTYDALVKSVQGLQEEAKNVGAVAYGAPTGKTMGRTFELQQAWLIWASTCTTLTGVPGDASMPSKEGGTKGCLIFLPPNGGAARTFNGFDWAVAVR